MGVFDSVYVPCPGCGKRHELQSKAGECCLDCFDLDNAPAVILADLGTHPDEEYTCDVCGCEFRLRAVVTATVEILRPRQR